jgi:hypothetical protein
MKQPFPELTLATILLSFMSVPDSGAQEQAIACKADVAKFCGQTQPGRGRMTQCLKQSDQDLSIPCRNHIKNVDLQLKETRQPCRDELVLYCEGLELTEPRIAQCLNRNKAAFSVECKRLTDLMQTR